MTEVYALLEAIDRKISVPSTFDMSNTIYSQGDIEIDQLLSNLEPLEAFHFAYKTNQIKLAEQILDLLKEQPYEHYLNKVCALAIKGSAKAMQELEQCLPKDLEEAQFDTILEIIGSLVSCYMRRNSEADKLPLMNTFFEQAYDKAISNRERAAILNQKQRMFASARHFEEAKELAEQMIRLNDEEPSYYFNYAIILDNLNDVNGAKLQIKKCIAISSEDKPHEEGLMLACRLFKDSSQEEDKKLYREYISKLEKVNPYKARIIRIS